MVFQSASRVMLVKPAVFEFNPQTSLSNRFQKLVLDLSGPQIYEAAMRELSGVYNMYADAGVAVEVFESDNRNTPDAIFPNSVSTFDGAAFGQEKPVAILHPMQAQNRIAERSEKLVSFFRNLGYDVKDDLLWFEPRGLALEGTGSVVMDHINKIAYCALSPRTHLDPAHAFAQMIGYRLEAFETMDANGKPVYHTDLVMNIGTGFAEVCLEVIAPADRERIRNSLRAHREDINELTIKQFNAFCGNSLEVRNADGKRLFSTTTRALRARADEQIARIKKHVKNIIHTRVRMIERVGGGSDRCLTQELHGLEGPSLSERKDENFFITLSSANSPGSSEGR